MVERVVSFGDIFDDPDRYVLFDVNEIIICDKCHKRLTLSVNPKRTTLRCGCGCRIIYEPNAKGARISTFVSKDEYLRGFKNGVSNGSAKQGAGND